MNSPVNGAVADHRTVAAAFFGRAGEAIRRACDSRTVLPVWVPSGLAVLLPGLAARAAAWAAGDWLRALPRDPAPADPERAASAVTNVVGCGDIAILEASPLDRRELRGSGLLVTAAMARYRVWQVADGQAVLAARGELCLAAGGGFPASRDGARPSQELLDSVALLLALAAWEDGTWERVVLEDDGVPHPHFARASIHLPLPPAPAPIHLDLLSPHGARSGIVHRASTAEVAAELVATVAGEGPAPDTTDRKHPTMKENLFGNCGQEGRRREAVEGDCAPREYGTHRWE